MKKRIGCVVFILMLTGCFKNAPAAAPFTTQTAVTVPQGRANMIAHIQGAGHVSHLRGQDVDDIYGIVTVVKSDGFYLQSQIPDDNPATSEGIFVFTDWVPGVRSGDEVSVSGRVAETTPGDGFGNLSRTQINAVDVMIVSRGNALPAPVIIGADGRMPPTEVIDDDSDGIVSKATLFDPENDGMDFFESLEGMLVQINDAVVVGPTNSYKEIVVLGDLGAHAAVRTLRGGIVVRENDFNPERIILDDLLTALPLVKVGDTAAVPIVGVMDYTFGNYKFLVTSQAIFSDGGLERGLPLTSPDPGFLRIASYNVQNLSAVQPERINQLADQIVNMMGSPDIIGLQEIMDDDGDQADTSVSADRTYQAIIDAVLNKGGPRYAFVNIDPIKGGEGGVPLGNIRVGFLYRTDTDLYLMHAPHGDAQTAVAIANRSGTPELTANPGRIDPANPAFFGSRRPLVVAFRYRNQPLFVVNNHFVSKGADQSLFGEFQPPILSSEAQRISQALVVHDFVNGLLAVDPDSLVVVLGDFNDFQFSPPLRALEGEILHNLIKLLPVPEQYTYIHDGNSQALDHILATNPLVERLVSIDIVHLNAEYPFMERFSDHDAVIATFGFD